MTPVPETTMLQLSPADVAEMRALRAVFADAFDDRERYEDAPPSDAYLRRLLARDHFIALAAVDDGAVVGGLTAYALDKYEAAECEVYIYDLAVLEAHRRRGIATALIERLKRIAAERGAKVIFVQADYGDDPAVALYTKLGVREDVMHFDIAVRAAS
jgi:ribosomal protein S18 acetylase RimI-like enzyme